MSGSIFDPLYEAVAHTIVGIHAVLQPIFGRTNGYGWALSIVLLTVIVRGAMFPLFVKQIKSQRQLQVMQPKIKELRDKYKHDRQKMNEEMLKLQREHGNPLLGCLPIFAQIPLFLALFRTLSAFRPRLQGTLAPHSLYNNTETAINCHDSAQLNDHLTQCYQFVSGHGLTAHQATVIGNARVFGVPLSAALKAPVTELKSFPSPSVSHGLVIAVALVMMITMAATTYITQRQIIGRTPATDPNQRMQQRLFLYLAPGSLLISGTLFPIGVLTYWLTTNLWSMGQQFFVLRTMPAPGSEDEKKRQERLKKKGKVEDTPAPAPVRYQQVRRDPNAPVTDGDSESTDLPGPEAAKPSAGAASSPAKPRPPGPNRPQGNRNRSKKKRKGGRR